MIESWLIKASAPICGTDTYYCAFSDGDPLGSNNFPYNEITDELWDNYHHLLNLDDEEYESQEEEDEAYDQAYENWECDCSFSSDKMSLEEIQEYLPNGASINEYIIYDERNEN